MVLKHASIMVKVIQQYDVIHTCFNHEDEGGTSNPSDYLRLVSLNHDESHKLFRMKTEEIKCTQRHAPLVL